MKAAPHQSESRIFGSEIEPVQTSYSNISSIPPIIEDRSTGKENSVPPLMLSKKDHLRAVPLINSKSPEGERSFDLVMKELGCGTVVETFNEI